MAGFLRLWPANSARRLLSQIHLQTAIMMEQVQIVALNLLCLLKEFALILRLSSSFKLFMEWVRRPGSLPTLKLLIFENDQTMMLAAGSSKGNNVH